MVEQRIDAWAHRRITDAPAGRLHALVVELVVFVLKQGWACLFGGLMLAAILAARIRYPDDAALARNDLLTIVAVALQVTMLATRLETPAEMRVVMLFHLTGTGMELFKTDVGSWQYAADGVLRIGGVPLFSGFMYAAVGSYLVRVMRIFDLRFERYPRQWVAAVLAAAIYVNFFSHHFVADARWVLLAAAVVVFGRSTMHFRVHAHVRRMPVLLAFTLVAGAIWVAENVGTITGTWLYPDQVDGWQPVSPNKVVAWFLLMQLSVALVTWVHRPAPPTPLVAGRRRTDAASVDPGSPGRFPGLVDPTRPLDISRYARNPRLARVCSDLGIAQELGEGIRRIFSEMRSRGLSDPLYTQTASSVQLTLFFSDALAPEIRQSLPQGALSILDVLRRAARPLGTGEVADAAGVTRPTASRHLQRLQDVGLVAWDGQSRKDPRATWRLT